MQNIIKSITLKFPIDQINRVWVTVFELLVMATDLKNEESTFKVLNKFYNF